MKPVNRGGAWFESAADLVQHGSELREDLGASGGKRRISFHDAGQDQDQATLPLRRDCITNRRRWLRIGTPDGLTDRARVPYVIAPLGIRQKYFAFARIDLSMPTASRSATAWNFLGIRRFSSRR